MKLRSKTFAVLLGGLVLSGCDGSSDAPAPVGIASLGDAFVAMFQSARNSEPVDAQSIPLAMTPNAEPFNP